MKDLELTMKVEQCDNGFVFRLGEITQVCYDYEAEKSLGKILAEEIKHVMDAYPTNEVEVKIVTKGIEQ